MLHRLQKLLCAVLALTMMLASACPARAASAQVRINNGSARVYQSPSTGSASVAVSQGLQMTVTGVSGGWARVSYKGRTGYTPAGNLDLANGITAYANRACRVYKSPSTGSASVAVSVNARMYVVGKSGGFYRVKNSSGVTGYIPTGCLSKTRVSTASGSGSGSWKSRVIAMDWFKGGENVLKKGQYGYIYDIKSGYTIRIKRMGGSNHADVEPATKSDTAKLYAMCGGSYSWDSRPVILYASGKFVACAINTMPHGDQTISNNGFNGQFCLHMVNSLTHGSQKVNSSHQSAIKAAYYWAH